MKDLVSKEKTILEVMADIYIFIMILLFPLMVDKTGFFKILEFKWYLYVTIASTYVIINILLILYFLIFKKINIFKYYKIDIVGWLALSFLGINVISTFSSPFFKNYNLFIGVGRGEGLIVSSLYILSFLVLSLFAKFKRKYIVYFAFSSILISLIAIMQYIGLNPFNMYQDGIGTHNVSFMGTLGNVSFVSAIYTMLLTISFSAYIFLEDNKKWEKLLYIISILMGFFIIGIIDVQSGKVAFLGTLVIVLPFILLNNKRVSRFLIMIATFLMAYGINVFINPEYHYDLNKLGLYWQFNYVVLSFIVISSIIVYLSYVISKNNYDLKDYPKLVKYYYFVILAMGIFSLLILYIVKFKSGILYEIHELLHGNFDDGFGTYRVFLWKRAIKLMPEYLLLGTGADTFAIRFMAKYTSDVASLGELTINDTAANVYLTMLVNLGVVGFLNYLLLIIFQIKNGIKKINNYSSILLLGFISYLIQDFFNLSVVIVTPIFWLLMALHYQSLFNEK